MESKWGGDWERKGHCKVYITGIRNTKIDLNIFTPTPIIHPPVFDTQHPTIVALGQRYSFFDSSLPVEFSFRLANVPNAWVAMIELASGRRAEPRSRLG